MPFFKVPRWKSFLPWISEKFPKGGGFVARKRAPRIFGRDTSTPVSDLFQSRRPSRGRASSCLDREVCLSFSESLPSERSWAAASRYLSLTWNLDVPLPPCSSVRTPTQAWGFRFAWPAGRISKGWQPLEKRNRQASLCLLPSRPPPVEGDGLHTCSPRITSPGRGRKRNCSFKKSSTAFDLHQSAALPLLREVDLNHHNHSPHRAGYRA